jgi:melanoma-associated antigen p97
LQGSALGNSIKDALVNAAQSQDFLSAATAIGGMDNFFLSKGTTNLARVDSSNFNDYLDPALQKSFTGLKELQASEQTPSPVPESPSTNPSPTGTTADAQTKNSYVICFPVDTSVHPSFLNRCTEALSIANQNREGITFSCSTAKSAEGCMEQVKNGNADLAKFGPSDIFLANRDYGLEPIVSEYYGGVAGNSYYSVAVVKKELCDANPGITMQDLKGKRSCHTGYRKTAGWTMPVGFLADTGIIPVKNSDKSVNADAESVAAFFSQVCAVGSNEDGPLTGGGQWDGLCTACGDDCSENSPYASYEGTIRGLMEGLCDVAFTKQETAPQVVSDGTSPESWSTLSSDDLRLLCPLGGCKPIDEWQNCNMAAIPSQAFVGPVSIQRTEAGAALKKALAEAGSDTNFIKAAQDVDGTSDYILTTKTESLKV